MYIQEVPKNPFFEFLVKFLVKALFEDYSKNTKPLKSADLKGFLSVREKIRTPDTLVRSQVLYPAELHAHILLTARDRDRTGTVSPQQDFKSCASASSATRASS